MSDLSASRVESDLLGEKLIPSQAYYGIQSHRAFENFQLSGIALYQYPNFIRAIAMVKQACALANFELGLLSQEKLTGISRACLEVQQGKLHEHFQVDMLQGGAGTSTNMNANEVIANRALELLGHNKGEYQHLHPNDDVNMSQSTNDVYPSAINLAVLLSNSPLMAELGSLAESMSVKGSAFSKIVKMGRTQLQDAVPMTLGQEFSAYGKTIRKDQQQLCELSKLLFEINLGGTAIGTGINADAKFGKLAIKYLAVISGYPFHQASNLIEASADTGAYVLFSSMLKSSAVKLSKISNDLRLLSSGPRAGLYEINLPPVQAGSSIMPGKVNPVIPEAVNQVAYQVVGNDLAVCLAAEAGQLQLNAMEPLIVFKLLQSIDLLTRALSMLRRRCVDGITANADVCGNYLNNSIGIITALNPYLGYENTSRIAKKALQTGRRVADLVMEEGLMSEAELQRLISTPSISAFQQPKSEEVIC
jgi:aspartate ammonia-lyase